MADFYPDDGRVYDWPPVPGWASAQAYLGGARALPIIGPDAVVRELGIQWQSRWQDNDAQPDFTDWSAVESQAISALEGFPLSDQYWDKTFGSDEYTKITQVRYRWAWLPAGGEPGREWQFVHLRWKVAVYDWPEGSPNPVPPVESEGSLQELWWHPEELPAVDEEDLSTWPGQDEWTVSPIPTVTEPPDPDEEHPHYYARKAEGIRLLWPRPWAAIRYGTTDPSTTCFAQGLIPGAKSAAFDYLRPDGLVIGSGV